MISFEMDSHGTPIAEERGHVDEDRITKMLELPRILFQNLSELGLIVDGAAALVGVAVDEPREQAAAGSELHPTLGVQAPDGHHAVADVAQRPPGIEVLQ